MNMIKEFFVNAARMVGGCISKYSFSRFLLCATVLAAAAIATELCILAIFKGVGRVRRNGGDRTVAVVSAIQTMVAVGTMLIVVLSGLWFLGLPVTMGSAEPEPVDRSGLAGLEASNWAQMGTEERAEVLQLLVDVEREKLGIPEKLVLTVEDLGRKNGEYTGLYGVVQIDPDHLENSPEWRVIETVCHEVYHCYEHCLVDIYTGSSAKNRHLSVFEKAKQYKWEFENYVDPEGREGEAFYEYYDQEVERDARAYATMTAPEYYPWMEGRVPEGELSQ